MKTPNEAQLRELNRMKEWCLFILGFARMTDPDQEKNSWLWDMMSKTTVVTADAGNLRQMRTMVRDTNDMAMSMTRGQIEELNRQLRERFDEDLTQNTEKTRDLAAIARIRKRGRIRSEDEFRLIQARTEEIWDDSQKTEEMEALNKLLTDFEPPSKNEE